MESLAVVLIRNNRRLLDNSCLKLAESFDRYFLLALYPAQWEISDRMSEKRKAFFYSSLTHFKNSLGEIPLHLSHAPWEVLSKLNKFKLTLIVEEEGSTEEEAILKKLSDFSLIKTRPNTIFTDPKLSPTFTPFRKRLEAYGEANKTVERAKLLKEKAITLDEFLYSSPKVPEFSFSGEEAGLKRASSFFKHSLSTYKETRDYLEDSEGSSKFSYFLSQGELSARFLYHKIQELDPGNWLGVELLWREFFWQHKIDFTLPSKGENIPEWEKKIKHPLACAIYQELVQTGYISNRSRQILASYLIYDLGLDWKIGASFYEKHLLDYDVFVNWGNWQYIAGVKFDPRGGRKFNLDLQQEKFDPEASYIEKWVL